MNYFRPLISFIEERNLIIMKQNVIGFFNYNYN